MADTVHELTAAYALDALDDHEAREYEEHLRRCDRCRSELGSLQEIASLLAYGAEPVAPPPGLGDRIVDAARLERPKVVRLRPRWAYPLAAGAAIAAGLAIGLGIWATSLSHSLDRERGRSALLDPGARVVALRGVPGRLVVSSTGKAALVLSKLPPAASGKTYEAWVVPKGGKPQPAGLFAGGPSGRFVSLDRPVPPGAVVAVTREAKGGSKVPHGRMLLTAQA